MSELRHNNVAWIHMTNHGGTWFRNFGDELSALVIREASGTKPAWAPMRDASMIGIGSIIELYTSRGGAGYIWGSGIRSDKATHVVPPSKVLAVRGAYTRDHLGLPADTTLGDPGLLARALYRRPRRRSGELVLPHFSSFANPTGRRAIQAFAARGSRILAPSAPVDEVCREIAGCGHLLTSSLHGLVVADALGTPATLVNFAAIREPQFKYADYASVFGHPVAFASVEHVLDSGTSTHLKDANARLDHVAPQIDEIVDGLFKAATKFA